MTPEVRKAHMMTKSERFKDALLSLEREEGAINQKNVINITLNARNGKEMDSLYRLPFTNSNIHLANKLLFGSQES